MAVDIGPRIGIDGEKEFRQQITNINQQLRTLGSEMKEVTSAFADNADSEEALAAKTEVLNRQIDAQKQKVALMEEGLRKATEQFGEADTRTLKWEQGLREARTALNRMEGELRNTNSRVDDFSEEASDATDSMDDFSGRSKKWVSSLTDIKSGFDIAIGVIKNVYGAIKNVIMSFVDLGKETREFRSELGKLNAAFSTNGKSVDDAWSVYKRFYAILGDQGQATEASQLLANLTSDTREMSKWVGIAAGVYGTFGDSLPIEALIESVNETARVGQVTGNLADALNWVSISEDEFNKKLAETNSTSERNALITATLGKAYDTATDSFYSANDQIVALRENEAEAEKSTAALGAVADEFSAKVNSDFAPSINKLTKAFADLVKYPGSDEAKREFERSLDELLKDVEEKIPEYIEAGTEIAAAVVEGVFKNIPGIIKALDTVNPFSTFTKNLFGKATGSDDLGNFAESASDAAYTATSSMRTPGLSGASQVAGLVNGIASVVKASEPTYRVEIPLNINGQQFSRAILTDLRTVIKSDPEVKSGIE